MRRSQLLAPLLLCLPWVLVACDNPACVFAPNGCKQGGGGGSLGSRPAQAPADGAWIEPTSPMVQSVAPSGSDAHPGTPIVITFSESLAEDSLGGAFEVFESSLGAPMPFLDPPPLVGDGRMVVLNPLAPLQLGATYEVRFSEDGQPTDLTGQLVSQGPDPLIGSFAVATTTPATPDVIATYPVDLTAGQSDIGEMVVVFDRQMDAGSFDTDSWAVTVGGATPAVNPKPVPLAILGGPVPITIESVWRWASVDSDGNRLSLGTGQRVEVELSSPGNKLEDDDGNLLPATVFEYDLASFAVPAEVAKAVLSDPDDAIGKPNLEDVVPVLQVELLANAQSGDVIDLFLFGQGLDGQGLVALSRSVTVQAASMLIDVGPAALALLSGGLGVIKDGNLHVAARLQRGSVRTPVRMLDIDPDTLGAQPLRFDVTAPTLLGLGTSGSVTSSFASDLRDLVIVGRANEQVRQVEVSASTGDDNGAGARAIMAAVGGLFVARPVGIGSGVLDPSAPVTYTVRVFDRALNPQAAPVVGTFLQRGTVGPGVPPEGGMVEVHVFDAGSLAPLEGALVMVHQDAAGVFTPVGSGVTDAAGFVSLTAAAVGTETIVTVDLAGPTLYDLWTFHGVPSDTLQVPLARSSNADASSEGSVTSTFPTVNLTTFRNSIGDSRRPDDQPRLIEVDPCGLDSQNFIYDCPFGPAAVLPARLGGQVFVSGDFGLNLGSFSASGFLRGFTSRFPIAPLASGASATGVNLFVGELLAASEAERQPLASPTQFLSDASAPNLGSLDGDPLVTIEALSPGLPGPLPVGLGIPFDQGGGTWIVEGAYPGVADGIDDGGGDQLGEFVTDGTIEADLFLRVELTDTDGNRVGARPRFSNQVGTLGPLDVPLFQVPGPGGNSGGSAFNLQAQDVLPDALGMAGLYRFRLQDSTGRGWTIWRPDPPGSGSVAARVPDVTDFVGGAPLADGALTCRISAFAWTGLDGSEFLWTDVEREQEAFAHTFPVPFTQD